MAVGIYKIALQADIGYYASVKLEAEYVSSNELTIEFDDKGGIDKYRVSAQFGVEYAWERARYAQTMTGLMVKILQVSYAPVDTTSPIVVLAAANALWKALGFKPAFPPILDSVKRGVFLPR